MNPLDNIPLDKSHHAIAGAILGAIGAIVAIQTGHRDLAWAAALVLPALGGIAKEVSDYIQNRKANAEVHGVEFMDALATFLGGVPVAVPLMM